MTTSNEPGAARSPGVTYQQLLDADTHPVPAVLRLESPQYLGDSDFSVKRYTTTEWHALEVEKLWSQVWQYTCRVEEIPEVGDYHVYEIATKSYFVIRTGEDTFKAYPNACLHRGRKLKDYDGRCSEIRCPFHGFAWELDGDLKDVPARWDFPHVEEEQFHLPEVHVGVWQGFIFINPAAECEPLEEFVKDLDDQFQDHWDFTTQYKSAHVAKVVPANWKVAQEAFCEAYHVNATHPQIMPYLGDTNSQVDIWENCARVITPSGTASPLLWYDVSEDDMLRTMLDIRHDQELPFSVPENATMRATMAGFSREGMRANLGDLVDTMADAEFMDSIDYTLWPNFHPWGAFNPIVYRFRPNGNDHRTSIMECIFMAPWAGDQADKPAPAEIHWLEEHEVFSDAEELGTLGKVFDQDLFNMPRVQQGLESTHKAGVTLGNYQESKLRWLHQKLDKALEVG